MTALWKRICQNLQRLARPAAEWLGYYQAVGPHHNPPADQVSITINADVHFHFHGPQQADALRAMTAEVKMSTQRLKDAIDAANSPTPPKEPPPCPKN